MVSKQERRWRALAKPVEPSALIAITRESASPRLIAAVETVRDLVQENSGAIRQNMDTEWTEDLQNRAQHNHYILKMLNNWLGVEPTDEDWTKVRKELSIPVLRAKLDAWQQWLDNVERVPQLKPHLHTRVRMAICEAEAAGLFVPAPQQGRDSNSR